ncbi:MAG: D-alanine--D-alanine ligase [Clostridia bacterium]|nr:D-alanine--D-alanine ligase [Clostridia bacterium]
MKKLKVGIIFGGMSTEHDVSVISGTSILKNINKNLYDIFPIYIEKSGTWYSYEKKLEEIEVLKIGEKITDLVKIENITDYLKKLDVVFPVLHGLYGEDGSIQGLFKLLNIPYVGCNILSSCICMDKAYTKIILEKAGIPQVKHIYIKKYKNKYVVVNQLCESEPYDIENLSKIIEQKLGLPVFIKPSNSGSSIGINKANNLNEVIKYIQEASNFDNKIIIEESINAREIECAVIGNEEVETAILGEIMPAEEYYSFNAKYNNIESKTKIPAELTEPQSEIIKNMAIKAFKAVDGRGLSRIDFFIDKESEKIYLNEINTMPGFTTISMYPQLFKKSGLSYSSLIDKLINLALEK